MLDRTLDVVFSRFRGFCFLYPWDRRPNELRACWVELQDIERVFSTPSERNSFVLLPQDYSKRQTPMSLKDERSCDLSVILINLCLKLDLGWGLGDFSRVSLSPQHSELNPSSGIQFVKAFPAVLTFNFKPFIQIEGWSNELMD